METLFNKTICDNCHKKIARLVRCKKCQSMQYCSKECRRAMRDSHDCEKLQKIAKAMKLSRDEHEFKFKTLVNFIGNIFKMSDKVYEYKLLPEYIYTFIGISETPICGNIGVYPWTAGLTTERVESPFGMMRTYKGLINDTSILNRLRMTLNYTIAEEHNNILMIMFIYDIKNSKPDLFHYHIGYTYLPVGSTKMKFILNYKPPTERPPIVDDIITSFITDKEHKLLTDSYADFIASEMAK